MSRLTVRGATSQRDINRLLELSNDNQFGRNEAYYKLQHYEDLEEQGRLTDWKRTSEEKPDSTRHLIAAYGEIISHYGYYLKPKDKWFTDWTCEKEIDEPMFWMDMPEPPKESLYSECCANMDEVSNE